MKKIKTKKYVVYLLSLASLKFSVKTIFLLFTLLLIIFQIYNGYEVYNLFDKVLYLFRKVTDIDIEINYLSFLSEFYVALHETQPKLFSDNRSLKALAVGGKKFSAILLYIYLILVLYAYLSVPDFNVFYYLKVGIHHMVVHKVLHFLHEQKKCKWYDCICYINKVKRYVKRKQNSSTS